MNFLDKLSMKTGFIKRKNKIIAEIFLTFNTFSSSDLCEASLSTLCTRLSSQFNIDISHQALNERFNEYSVRFMREIFKIIMLKQNKMLNKQSTKLHFNRILVNDATSYGLPIKFYDDFKGSGGSRSKSSIKIQLQYDLLSGSFLCCDIDNGTLSDGKYVETMDKYTKAEDLRLADLGIISLIACFIPIIGAPISITGIVISAKKLK